MILLLPIAAVLSCGQSKDYVLKVKLRTLNAESIYDQELVSDVIFDAEEQNIDSLKNRSRALFLQGIDLYKNKQKPKDAIALLKLSITVFPDAKSYYELGNALLDANAGNSSIQEAIKAYEVASYLNFQPESNVHFRIACAEGAAIRYKNETEKQDNLWKVMSALRSAFSKGFTDTTLLAMDSRISWVTVTPEYRGLVKEIASQKNNSSNSLFGLFAGSFPEINSRFEITLDKVEMGEYKESISYDFAKFIPEMENTSFGRDVSHDFYYVARLPEAPGYTAVIYSSINFYGEKMQPVHVTLATYDKEGNPISRKLIACQCTSTKVKKCIVENNRITIEDYKRSWEKGIDEVSFDENTITGHVLISKASFRIDESGKIVDDDVPANFNDSNLFVKH